MRLGVLAEERTRRIFAPARGGRSARRETPRRAGRRRAARSLRGGLVAGALVAIAAWVSGCGLPTGDTVVYTSTSPELASASVSDGVWESSPWPGPDVVWLPYPPRTTIELEHSLGVGPRSVLVYLSFEPSGVESAMAAGDLARVIDVNGATITLRNETSARFFARVVAF